jgi:hypothetical protein
VHELVGSGMAKLADLAAACRQLAKDVDLVSKLSARA